MNTIFTDLLAQLDAKTMLFATLIMVSLLSCIVYWQKATLEPKSLEIRRFATGLGAFAAGGGLLSMRGAIDPILSLTLGNGILVFAIFSCWEALASFFGARLKHTFAPWAFLAAIAASLPETPYAVSVLVDNLLLAFGGFAASWTVYKCCASRSTGRWMLVASFAIFGLASCSRMLTFASNAALGTASTLVTASPASFKILLLTTCIAGTLWSAGFLLLIGEALRERLMYLATHDALTGVLNRGAFFEQATRELNKAQRSGDQASVLLLDLDHFKSINDNFGHPAGDDVLRACAKAAMASVRQTDILARYGGEEFVVFLPGVDAQGARVVAERLRTKLSEASMPEAIGARVVTLSAGLADTLVAGRSLERLIDQADKALYEAKRAGRDRVYAARAQSMSMPAQTPLAPATFAPTPARI